MASSKDSSKAVVLVAHNEQNGENYLVSQLVPVYAELPNDSSIDYNQKNLDSRTIPWDTTKTDDPSGFGVNLTDLSRQVSGQLRTANTPDNDWYAFAPGVFFNLTEEELNVGKAAGLISKAKPWTTNQSGIGILRALCLKENQV